MKILICVKQVPGTNKVEVDPITGVLKRSGVKGKLNPNDLFALEMGISLCERFGGEVSTLTMGPPQAKEMLLETIYMGASDAVLLSDRRVAGSDVLATAYALSQAVERGGRYDLIICGKQTTDGDTGQVGAELAEFMGIPHACNVVEVLRVDDGWITVKLDKEHETITERLPLPCLICTESDINTPRLPSYKRKKLTIPDDVQTITLADLSDRDETHYGLEGSATRVERIYPPEKSESKQVFSGDKDELADGFYRLLSDKKFI